MESTGVYWIPAYELLEQRGFEVVLVNARDAKHVPGRKTDVSDAQWLRRLHEYGLPRASFRPKGELAALRAYLRQRERLLDYSASHIQHMQSCSQTRGPAAAGSSSRQDGQCAGLRYAGRIARGPRRRPDANSWSRSLAGAETRR